MNTLAKKAAADMTEALDIAELIEIFFFPICILLVAGILGQMITVLIKKWIEKYLHDEEITMKYVMARAVRGVPRSWIIITSINIAAKMLDSDPKLADIMDNLWFTVMAITVSQVLSRFFNGYIEFHMEKNSDMPKATLLCNLVSVIFYIIGILVSLEEWGVSVTPMLTALGVGGMAVALGLQDTLSNLFAGLYIIAGKSLHLNDYVRLSSGQEGRITDITWRVTTIQTIKGSMVIVPNRDIASSTLINFSRPVQDLGILVKVGVAYDSDLEQVERVTLEVAEKVTKEIEEEIDENSAKVRFHTLNDSSIDFDVILRCSRFDRQALLKHEFIKELVKRYREEGIEIPFPMRVVQNVGNSGEKSTK